MDSEDEEENNTLWMSATQFSQLLDKQEAMEMPIQQQQQQKLKSSPVKTSSTNSNSKLQTAKSDIMTSSSSFLDQQAMIPFKKLRQVTTAYLLFFLNTNRVNSEFTMGIFCLSSYRKY